MTTEAQGRDTLVLARAILNGYSGYGSLDDLGDVPPDHWERYGVELYVDTDDAAAISSAVGLVVLAARAASAIVEYSEAYGFELGDEPDYQQLRELIESDLVAVAIVGVEIGSLRLRFSIDPRTPNGRRRIIAIAGLMALALTPIWPAAAIITGVAAVAGQVDAIFTPDATVLETIDTELLAGVDGAYTPDEAPDV